MSVIHTIDRSYEENTTFANRGRKYHNYIPYSKYGMLPALRGVRDIIVEQGDSKSYTDKDNYSVRQVRYVTNERLPDIKFLDVGCGIGTTLLLANSFFRAYGLEINKKLWKVANQFTAPRDWSEIGGIYHINALKFNEYHKFDVIYYYSPILNLELQQKLELKIEKDMKVGAYILPIMKRSDRIITDIKYKKHFKRFRLKNTSAKYVFKKIKEIEG